MFQLDGKYPKIKQLAYFFTDTHSSILCKPAQSTAPLLMNCRKIILC